MYKNKNKKFKVIMSQRNKKNVIFDYYKNKSSAYRDLKRYGAEKGSYKIVKTKL